ncbi:hypothetical protein C4J93_4698 [Pseudomonas sp. R2-37-08W]|nr:hypothetical protein C4J93_4698 [Pseudomonas sp. R2-37-08W]
MNINLKKAEVIAFNKHVEEDVTLLIEGTFINCFISYCPYELEVGKTYAVELTLNLSDDYEIERTVVSRPLVKRIDRGYAYVLYGYLSNNMFVTFTSLHDEDIHYVHPECNEHFIKLKIERIDASFH